MTNHLMKRIDVNEETLLVEELDRVGPGGNFLDPNATRAHYRDFWFPELLDRKTRPNSEAGDRRWASG